MDLYLSSKEHMHDTLLRSEGKNITINATFGLLRFVPFLDLITFKQIDIHVTKVLYDETNKYKMLHIQGYYNDESKVDASLSVYKVDEILHVIHATNGSNGSNEPFERGFVQSVSTP